VQEESTFKKNASPSKLNVRGLNVGWAFNLIEIRRYEPFTCRIRKRENGEGKFIKLMDCL